MFEGFDSSVSKYSVSRRQALLGSVTSLILCSTGSGLRAQILSEHEMRVQFDDISAKLFDDVTQIDFMRSSRELGSVVELLPESALPSTPKSSTPISSEARKLIVFCEVSSEKHYMDRLQSPIWPGGESGVTLAIGYDVGYARVEQLQSDWSDWISNGDIVKLQGACGVTGGSAKHLVPQFSSVKVDFRTAMAQFGAEVLPKYVGLVEGTLKNCDKLHPDSLGALVSLVYNRGPSWQISEQKDKSGRYSEMRAIKALMSKSNFHDIPEQIRKMTRLWSGDPNMKGVVTRRLLEAQLFTIGLEA